MKLVFNSALTCSDKSLRHCMCDSSATNESNFVRCTYHAEAVGVSVRVGRVAEDRCVPFPFSVNCELNGQIVRRTRACINHHHSAVSAQPHTHMPHTALSYSYTINEHTHTLTQPRINAAHNLTYAYICVAKHFHWLSSRTCQPKWNPGYQTKSAHRAPLKWGGKLQTDKRRVL